MAGAENIAYQTHPLLGAISAIGGGFVSEVRYQYAPAGQATRTSDRPGGSATTSQWGSEDRATFEAAVAEYSTVSDLRFVEADGAADRTLLLQLVEAVPGGVGGYANSIFMVVPTGVTISTVTHELGHSVGLRHPFEGQRLPGVTSPTDRGDFGFNTRYYTQQSYTVWQPQEVPSDIYLNRPEGLGVLDIAVVQAMYGANTDHNIGDTVYGIDSRTRSIWDAGGHDVIDYSDATLDAVIDLRPATLLVEEGGLGRMSYLANRDMFAATQFGAYSIAYGVTIEEARGGEGHDLLIASDSGGTLIGGAGNDRLVAGIGSAVLDGGAGTDTAVVGFTLADMLDFYETDDGLILSDWQQAHTLRGVEGLSFADQTLDAAQIAALLPQDPREVTGAGRITGGTGDDTLTGSDGRDILDGGRGADTMLGGLGNDTYLLNRAEDVIAGEQAFAAGGGIDTARVFFSGYVTPENIELVRLGYLTDTTDLSATGNDAPGTLVGNAGNNRLTGRGGNDQINGNDGDDVLIGNTGRDTLVGGAGADTFVYNSVSETRSGATERDVINGFERGIDRIDLAAMDANLSLGGDQGWHFVGIQGFDGSAGQLRLQGLGGANAVLIEGDLRGDGRADFQIFVNLVTVLEADDFLL